MHDPFAWSLPLGRLFGITVRVHWLFPSVAAGRILHTALNKPYKGYKAPRGAWLDWLWPVLSLVLVGFPIAVDRMLQPALWLSLVYRQATRTAVFAGFAVVFVVGLYAIIRNELLALCLALFVYVACQRQWVVL